MINYILETTISLIILFLCYSLFFRKDKLLIFKRFYLLFAVVFSFSIPFFDFSPTEESEIYERTISNIEGTITVDTINEKFLKPSQQIITEIFSEENSSFEFYNISLILYFIVIAFLLFRFAKNLHSLISKTQKSKTLPFKNVKIVLDKNKTVPFCFLKYIYINKSDYENGLIKDELLNHELAHLQQFHTLDILFIELVQIIFWFNPILFFYKKAIKANHEYLADAAAIKKTKRKKEYCETLVNFASRNTTLNLASGYNSSLIKRRIEMIAKQSSNLKTSIKISLLVPIFVFLLVNLISCKTSSQKKEEMHFTPLHCEELLNDAGKMIARDIVFTLNGVKFKSSLISLDYKTRSFKSFINGKLLVNKAEIEIARDKILNKSISYSADKIEKKGDIIYLLGNAKIEEYGNYLKTNEIIITLI